ncbi:Phosphoglycolate phosphatase [Paenibacillus konkukensis]|uniref:Phosphoglycolate phosphatase n=1 Tax=Paenibacillus konkukensis TaxID=2020716 RepID=A0ABY4RVL3_9BACL|nr:HAD hydrolase-like protein [Paenibacillus konkukensis]UQZ85603.1 Phosphoglycolate phosphatase [Paenibacillus konkukensis]
MNPKPLRFAGIIFDMDNTLLRSHIDFARMKREVRELLLGFGVMEEETAWDRHTTVTMIDSARSHRNYTDSVDRAVWRRVAAIEEEGMAGADLEPGVAECLEAISGKLVLTVLTNNADAAAFKALRETGIDRYFAKVVGRDGTTALKPAPDGVQRILRQYEAIPPHRWLSVGDSWIDGMAAQLAGVPFVAYGPGAARMEEREVRPLGAIEAMHELMRFL